MPEPSFGVVLLNWNGCNDTIAALDSLIAATPRPSHVVVVDNGSSDNSLERLRVWGQAHAPSFALHDGENDDALATPPWLLLIAAGGNRGFSGGNNIGLRYLAANSSVTHFLLLNNDAMVAPDYFAQMAGALAVEPDAGLMGCLIFHHPERERVWFAGGYEIPHRALVLHHHAVPAGDAPRATEFVTGCAMCISRALYDAQGGLAECYNPIYWEDGDYSFRARTRGWPVLIAPAAHVYHRVGATSGGETITPRVAFWQNRNRVFYVRRNYRGVRRLIALGYLAATKPARAVVETLRGRGDVGSAILRGFVRGLLDSAA